MNKSRVLRQDSDRPVTQTFPALLIPACRGCGYGLFSVRDDALPLSWQKAVFGALLGQATLIVFAEPGIAVAGDPVVHRVTQGSRYQF